MSVPLPRRSLLLVAIVLTTGALLALVGTQHRMRLAIGVWQLVDSAATLDVSPTALHSPWRFAATGDARNSSFDSALRIAQDFERTPRVVPEQSHAMLDDPDSSIHALEQGRQLHCYNVAIATSALLARHGIYSRMWDIDGHDGLGGNGHNLLEVWDGRRQQWCAFDPFYRCYFTRDSSTQPLSFRDVRLLSITDRAHVIGHHFLPNRPVRPTTEVVLEYNDLSPLASVHSDNDYRWRYDHRYGVLQPLAFAFDRLPLKAARAFRTLMIGASDTRFVIRDQYTPKHHFRLVSLGFRALLALAVLLLAFDVLLGIRDRRMRRRIHDRPPRSRTTADVA